MIKNAVTGGVFSTSGRVLEACIFAKFYGSVDSAGIGAAGGLAPSSASS